MEDRGYEQVCNTYRQLLDVRFKLLALVPAISGFVIALITKDLATFESLPLPRLVVAFFGFVVTLGIVFYDQRNNQLYNAIVRRGHTLEEELEIKGAFSQRQERSLKFFGLFTIWHDRGIALIYGSVLGAWAFPISCGLIWLCQGCKPNENAPIYAAVIALFVCILLVIELHRLEKKA